jgi:3-dehydroquinate dehydratase-1
MLKRLELSNPRKIGKLTLGKKILFCAPVTKINSKVEKKILQYSKNGEIDIYEVRYDYFVSKNVKISKVLEFFKSNQVPYIFTFRSKEEGGKSHSTDKDRIAVFYEALDYEPAMVDIEYKSLSKNEEFKSLVKEIKKASALILSYHNFYTTLNLRNLKEIAVSCFKENPDIIKIATLNRTFKDLLILMQLSYWMRKTFKFPQVVIGMGRIGAISRIMTSLLGSDIIYVKLFERTAKGQPNIDQIKLLFKILESL